MLNNFYTGLCRAFREELQKQKAESRKQKAESRLREHFIYGMDDHGVSSLFW